MFRIFHARNISFFAQLGNESQRFDYLVFCIVSFNRQFQLLVSACREGWEVRYHNNIIADYAEKIKLVAV
jgi:hypothetical protein